MNADGDGGNGMESMGSKVPLPLAGTVIPLSVAPLVLPTVLSAMGFKLPMLYRVQIVDRLGQEPQATR